MRVYFNEHNALVIDGEGTEVKFDPGIKTAIYDTPTILRNFSFVPKPKPVYSRVDSILVANRELPVSRLFPVLIGITDATNNTVYDEKSDSRLPGDILSIEATKRLIAALQDAITYAEAMKNES